MLTMFGWFSAASARASRPNRSRSSTGVEVGVQQLERDEAVGVGIGVPGEVERSHPARTDEGLDLVATDAGRLVHGEPVVSASGQPSTDQPDPTVRAVGQGGGAG